jgi:uncharacterized Zn finger protein
MCKPLAAVLYGVGSRLDAQPQLLFTLRGADAGLAGAEVPASKKVLVGADLTAVFGLYMAEATEPSEPAPATAKPRKKASGPKRKAQATGELPAKAEPSAKASLAKPGADGKSKSLRFPARGKPSPRKPNSAST